MANTKIGIDQSDEMVRATKLIKTLNKIEDAMRNGSCSNSEEHLKLHIKSILEDLKFTNQGIREDKSKLSQIDLRN